MVYTNKDKVRCFIAAGDYRIEGDMHVLSGSRLTDALNSKTHDFIVVTSAKVFNSMTDKLLFEPEYLAVNRESVSVIFPLPQ